MYRQAVYRQIQVIHRLFTGSTAHGARGSLGTPRKKIRGELGEENGVVKKRRGGVKSRRSDEGNSVCVARGYRARTGGVAGVVATRCGDFFDG